MSGTYGLSVGNLDFLNQLNGNIFGANVPANANGVLDSLSLGGANGLNGLGTGFGFNLDTAKLGIGALGALGNIWSASQASDLAKKQFDFVKSVGNTNLNNQIASYNTALEDRTRARAIAEGQSQDSVQAYLDRNRLTRSS